MAEAFLGLKATILLHNGAKIEGTIYDVDPNTKQITLKDATLHFFGQLPYHTPIHGVYGRDIKDLFAESYSQHEPELITPSLSTSKSKKRKQRQNRKNMNNNKNAQGWADTDVNSFREEEFDFQKHLDKFNKAEIFAEIRDSDKTSKEDLLVTHNRLPQRNLLPTENVLDVPIKPPSPPSSIRAPAISTALKTATSGTPCPLLSVTELIRIQRKCTTVLPHFEDLAIENSARGAAVLAMRLLRHSHLSSSIVILAGNTRIGAIGLAAARLLINRGYPATICIVYHDRQALCPDVAREEELLHNFGIPVVYDPSRIQGAYDLVMDAILGSENKLMDNLAEFHAWTKAISWANQQPKPIMSIDFPSGVDADTGHPQHAQYFIHPQWTVCLGAPKLGCKSTRITGALYLVDIGIPRKMWEQAGIDMSNIFWEAETLVNLTYDAI
ncbi:enhancer of mRNA decapping [Rhizopus azygosporus]|uniref:Enhancer of mRNA-decapping protein 3 n=1 Tax=Rhizopus azygosporus TaxID=86630 RepID=A0A367K9C5_RHIAZ|nr:enhancer of mRNA decapping [Rhizopus azygosporus]